MFALAEGDQKPLTKRMMYVVAKMNNLYFCFSYASIWEEHILYLYILGKHIDL